MTTGDPRAEGVFAKDVHDTYGHLVERVNISKKEEEEAKVDLGTEQIQLVPEHDDVKVTFTVPEGPPPAELRLTGPGTEDLDIEEVRRALQLQWEIYEGFSEELKTALKEQSLEKVNKILAEKTVEDATAIVTKLDKGGILSFAEGGIRDETGRVDEPGRTDEIGNIDASGMIDVGSDDDDDDDEETDVE